MHAYRVFIQQEMDKRGWKATDLARASGLSKQVISSVLTDTRDQLRMLPAPATITGLARAFATPENLVRQKIAEAMGLPAGETIVVYDAARVPNDLLIRELERRLDAAPPPNGNPNGAFIADAITPDPEHDQAASDPAATPRSTPGPDPEAQP